MAYDSATGDMVLFGGDGSAGYLGDTWATARPLATVTFKANGGTGTMAPEAHGAPTSLKANAFTRSGYTFSGWNTKAGGGGTAYANGATYPFTANATLYAQWRGPTRTVTFKANGGTGTMAPEAHNTSSPLSKNTFARSGYTFGGWNTAANGSGTAYANGASYPFTADATLFAQWKAKPPTVTFNANGGVGTMASESHSSRTALTANSFTRAGYFFAGWNTAANGSGTAYANDATYPFTSSTTLYAQWRVVSFTACVGSNIPAGYVPTALYSAPDNCGDTNNLYGYNDAQYTYFVSGTSLAVCNVGESYIVPSTEAPTGSFQYQHLRRSVSQCRWL